MRAHLNVDSIFAARRSALRKVPFPRCILRALALVFTIGLGASVAHAQGYADLVARIAPAVVFVHVIERDGRSTTGSGFVVSPDGYVLTARHVVIGAERIFVKFSTGTVHEGTVVESVGNADSAWVKVPGSNYPTAPRSPSPALRQGDEVLVFGYPGGSLFADQVTVTKGIVSALRRHGLLIQIDAAMSPGNSGGPVVTTDGRVVGMVLSHVPAFPGMNFAVSVRGALPSLSRLPGRPAAQPLMVPEHIIARWRLVLGQLWDRSTVELRGLKLWSIFAAHALH